MKNVGNSFGQGKTPWGWRRGDDGTLVPDERERNICFVAQHMAANGHTPSMIVEFLTGIGVLNREGKPFNRTRIIEMIEGGREPRRRRRVP